jgi:hypothetical protein
VRGPPEAMHRKTPSVQTMRNLGGGAHMEVMAHSPGVLATEMAAADVSTVCGKVCNDVCARFLCAL